MNHIVLVTGAAGFIGFHLVEALVNRGYHVIGIDNINDYYDVGLKFARLKESGIVIGTEDDWHLPIQSNKYPNYHFIRVDLVNKLEIQRLFREYEFDFVVNLAAQAGVRYSIENPDAYIQSNVLGFLNILEGCRHHHIKHLVYASSSSVYGMNRKMPFSVTDNVDHPVSLYAATKKSNELMAHVYSHLYDIPTTALRFFTVYGPWGRPDMAYYLFAEAIRKGESIKVFNHGKLKRDFTYVDDIVSGIVDVLDKPANSNLEWDPLTPDPSSSAAPYRVYNIGNNQPVELLDFINTLGKAMGKQPDMILTDMQPGDVLATWADVDDLMVNFNYKPNTDIKSGLEKFVTWYKEYYKI